METLTKENFWNSMQEKYPEQMKIFSDWVDGYKKLVDWNNLLDFNPNTPRVEGQLQVYKYHDLPIAMQVGIFIQFVMETKGIYEFTLIGVNSMNDWPAKIESWFDEMKQLEIGKFIEPIIDGEKLFGGQRSSVQEQQCTEAVVITKIKLQNGEPEEFNHLEDMVHAMHGGVNE